MTPQLIIEPCTKENAATIISGINSYNLSQIPAIANTWTPLDFVIKNESGIEIAGILSGIGYWNGLDIKVLWVAEAYRKTGIGSLILKHTEDAAREKGATVAMLDTFDFQAEGFYLKNGYKVIGEVQNFPPGHRRIYLSKKL
ncbi:acetyltransferase [Flavobacterium rivuli WB 3.3-2 = DSM 21788]|uniref:Acetyltransferase n=1 Tax=Flavobacterium rivuli WB 3.3-2 = DSM 21788 TaxID=1121895 RepID=A0A0A2LYI6_9FLAO|nr:GNAT family N-acetyltransferase [Flavobacterium rivuli]KGO85074.1 acetyltransferase [Flavobacterium rivuli WB 3.3-2 = DSM 21788]